MTETLRRADQSCSSLTPLSPLQAGLALSYAVWATSRSFSGFLVFRVVGGICKGNVSVCTAVVADLPCPKARNRGMVRGRSRGQGEGEQRMRFKVMGVYCAFLMWSKSDLQLNG